MDQINALWQYLCRFPLWREQALTVDTTPAEPGRCGLFSRGMEVLERKQDITGGQKLRVKQTFLLRRRGVRTAGEAAWLLQLQNWVLENPPRELEPVFGTELRLRMEKGRLTQTRQPGTAIYDGTIILEYIKEKCINED